MKNPYWTWWADRYKVQPESAEPVLGFLWGAQPGVAAKAPSDMPASKVFRGIGVAILNTTLVDSADNVQVRFKSSPFGRQSHGHDPHNAFTLNAYGEALLVNNVYRDLYGSPFHKGWAWETKSQNALLVNGQGQKPHSADPMGRIVAADFQDGLEYVAGEAAAAYQGKLRRYVRHVYFVKPDVVILVDDAEAAQPATFQWMVHGLSAFEVQGQQARLDRPKAGVLVDYAGIEGLRLKQWDGYEPQPDWKYLTSVKSSGMPNQWHVEAGTAEPAGSIFAATVLRPYRAGHSPTGAVRASRKGETLVLTVPGASGEVTCEIGRKSARFRKGGKTWTVRPQA
jgi:hypothetical protein